MACGALRSSMPMDTSCFSEGRIRNKKPGYLPGSCQFVLASLVLSRHHSLHILGGWSVNRWITHAHAAIIGAQLAAMVDDVKHKHPVDIEHRISKKVVAVYLEGNYLLFPGVVVDVFLFFKH